MFAVRSVGSGEFESLRLCDQLVDAGFDIVEGVGERGELSYSILLAFVGRFPVVYRPRHRRCRFNRRLIHGRRSDGFVGVEHSVVGQAGVGLPREPGGGVRAERLDRVWQLSPLVDRWEQRRIRSSIGLGI